MKIPARMIIQSCFPVKFCLNCKSYWHFCCRSFSNSGKKICWKIRYGQLVYCIICLWAQLLDTLKFDLTPKSITIQNIVPRLKAMTWNMANQDTESSDPAAVINLKVNAAS